MALGKAMSNLKFDKRMQDFNLRTGKVTAEELKIHKEALEDCESRSMSLKLDSKSDLDSLTEAPVEPTTFN